MADFSTILQRMLGRVLGGRDKRQGSIIFDTLSPTAAELANQDINIEIFQEQSQLLNAVGENLDNWASNFALTRNQATNAIRIGEMTDTTGQPLILAIGNRFATPNIDGSVHFTLIENLEPGRCLLKCEQPGTIGNTYLGPLLPLFTINNLGTATMIGTQIPAQDTETDDALRDRVLFRINRNPFGGNIDDYKDFVTEIDGVEDVKIFPVWDGGGTVKLSIIGSGFNPATPEFIDVVQELIDPIPYAGLGYGIAPIGHRVTVTTPTAISINIAANLSLQAGYSISQLQANIEAAIEGYMAELRKLWADAPSLPVYIARINAAIISVDGVNNVTGITINGSASDLTLAQTATTQRLPVLGNVVLSNV